MRVGIFSTSQWRFADAKLHKAVVNIHLGNHYARVHVSEMRRADPSYERCADLDSADSPLSVVPSREMRDWNLHGTLSFLFGTA